MQKILLPRPMEIARRISLLSEFDKRFKMGAVITKKGIPIGFGFNKLKTPGADYKNLFSVHAEISAIINSETNLAGATIWVYRETVNGMPGLSLPCDTCYGAILETGIKKIVYCIEVEPYYSEWKIK